ncbi:hypothetical protein KFK09_012841 [Dendrobium nobile]|uniref:TLC domain-containing protein n=1 Tax=Dendrobium nobile TaxID=94219 RepID=A0A8T3BIH0_DENNO|nr:hypothetical protein KFK09_012841 [Dendrobium nobile]
MSSIWDDDGAPDVSHALIAIIFALGFAPVRFLLDFLVYKRLAMRLLHSGRATLVIDETRQLKVYKCSESMWKFTYYVSVQMWVISILRQAPWLMNTKEYFKGWPNQELGYHSVEPLIEANLFPRTFYYTFNTMLLTLLVFHIYWWKLICAMLLRQLQNEGKVGEDIRSDSEDGE